MVRRGHRVCVLYEKKRQSSAIVVKQLDRFYCSSEQEHPISVRADAGVMRYSRAPSRRRARAPSAWEVRASHVAKIAPPRTPRSALRAAAVRATGSAPRTTQRPTARAAAQATSTRNVRRNARRETWRASPLSARPSRGRARYSSR